MLVGVIRAGKYVRAEDLPPEPERRRAFEIRGDIPPVISPVDGSIIGSRRARDEHNRRNECFDVGNDPAAKRRPPPVLPTTDPQLRKELDAEVGKAFRQHNPEKY